MVRELDCYNSSKFNQLYQEMKCILANSKLKWWDNINVNDKK